VHGLRPKAKPSQPQIGWAKPGGFGLNRQLGIRPNNENFLPNPKDTVVDTVRMSFVEGAGKKKYWEQRVM
jgi:hypothetical protein